MSKSKEEPKRGAQEKSASRGPEAGRPKVTFIDAPNVPDVFASYCRGLSLRHGNIHMTFVSDRYSHSENAQVDVVIGRLVMPALGVQDLMLQLYNFLKDAGLDPTPKLQAGEKMQ